MKQRNNCFLLLFLLFALFSCREKVVIGNDEYWCQKNGTDSLFCECQDSLKTKHGYVNVIKGVKQGMEYWLNEDHDTVAQAGFIDGKLCGFRKVFYPDGNLKYCGSLINGEQVGWHFHFF